MARSPFSRLLERELAVQHLSKMLRRPPEAVREELLARRERRQQGPPLSRRGFLGGAAATATAGLVGVRSSRAAPPVAGPQPTIAIVGGGLAGLAAAVELTDAGYTATVYDANPVKLGGRAQTGFGSAQQFPGGPACNTCHAPKPQGNDGVWADGQEAAMFGELIDTGHPVMLDLAQRFGLLEVDLLAAEPPGSTETYHFFGEYYPKEVADDDYDALWHTLHADVTGAGYPTTWDSNKAHGRLLDNMSIYDWIESRVPGGHSSPLGQLLDVAYAIEFGADTSDQSALNLVYLLGYGPRHGLSVFGESDERYRIQGGIGALPDAMADYVGWENIVLGAWLQSISQTSSGAYDLVFDMPGGPDLEVTADIVLLALPFAVLRNLDYAGAGFDARKDQAIQELGRGVNGKLQLQFTSRLWNEPGPWGISTGSCYSDTGFQAAWEATRGHPGAHGILLKYTGGSVTEALMQNHPYGNANNPLVGMDAAQFLTELEPLFPGISNLWNGKVAGSMPHLNERFGCSYSYWKVGQYQAFAGYEGVRQGNVFFAGEHTSYDFQGWMEGAARSGIDAASDIIREL